MPIISQEQLKAALKDKASFNKLILSQVDPTYAFHRSVDDYPQYIDAIMAYFLDDMALFNAVL